MVTRVKLIGPTLGAFGTADSLLRTRAGCSERAPSNKEWLDHKSK
jgi:hypothetical protein